MITRRNDSPQPFAVTFCTRPSHWEATEHDASDGKPCDEVTHRIEPGARLTLDANENNAAAITAALDTLGASTP